MKLEAFAFAGFKVLVSPARKPGAVSRMACANRQCANILSGGKEANADVPVVGYVAIQFAPYRLSENKGLHPTLRFLAPAFVKLRPIDAV
jgi:hypothetical protein